MMDVCYDQKNVKNCAIKYLVNRLFNDKMQFKVTKGMEEASRILFVVHFALET